MKCAVHPDVDATGYCRNCGKALCGVCARPVREVLYCEDCLATVMGLPTPTPPSAYNPAQAPAPAFVPPVSALPPAAASGRTTPSIAFFLGLFPGLGAVYNGEYNKALIHIVVFAAMIFGLTSELSDGAIVALSLLMAGFVIYMAFDAMRTAEAKNAGDKPADPLEVWSKQWPVGPIILIGLGALFLLHNFRFFNFFHIGMDRLWPLVLIGVGILMFRKRLGR